MGTKPQFLAIFFILLIFGASTATAKHHSRRRCKHHSRHPCKRLVFHMHDTIYNGRNFNRSTSAIVGNPDWTNKTTKADYHHFGDVVVFDDPITLDENINSPVVGRAQGMYFYDEWTQYTVWMAFSFIFNSTDYVGTLNFVGSDPTLNVTRDISVVGGTGDFFMARGIATLSTGPNMTHYYFQLRVDIKLYECW